MTETLKKTNVLRIFDQHKIPYRFYEYETKDGRMDAVSVAQKIGYDPMQVYKTLVTVGAAGHYYVFVIPSLSELDLKAAARAAGVKNVDMLPQKKLLSVTGYVHGGCSPVGMKKMFPTFFDDSVLRYDDICVSGGKVGVTTAVAAKDLLSFLGASVHPLVRHI